MAALDAFAGAERRIAVGLVGERLFLNNVSLGAYADLVADAARVATGRASPSAGWAQWDATTLRVDSRLPRLPAGIDGEAVVLTPPLEFRVLPRVLRVLVPAALPQHATRRLRPLSRRALRHLWVVARGHHADG